MRKFQFHMEKLLSYKGQVLDSEMMNLAVLNNMLENVQKRLAALENEAEKCRNEYQNEIENQLTPAGCRTYASYDKYIRDQKNICTAEAEGIKRQIESQIERVKNLKVETRSLETIKESRLDEYKKENLKKAELFIDEFVARSRIVNKAY